jgi:hypothetical protein
MRCPRLGRLDVWTFGRFGLILLPIVLLSACASDPTRGYAALSTYSPDHATVAVPILENDTFQRGIEFEITDALIKEIERRTPYRIDDQTRADTVLTGRIVRAELNQLSRSRETRLAEEMVLSVTIDFTWRDRRTNRTLLERRSFTGHGLFLPSHPSHEPLEIGRFSAAQELARDIVNEMRSEW